MEIAKLLLRKFPSWSLVLDRRNSVGSRGARIGIDRGSEYQKDGKNERQTATKKVAACASRT
jgi:hypothetical protein